MDNLSKASKIILSFAIIFFVLWLGGYFARHLIVYQLFEPENLDLLPIYSTQTLSGLLSTILPIFILNLITYLIFLLLFSIFLSISKINIKKHGWLFIITLIVIVTAPFELFLSYKDYLIIKSIIFNNSIEPLFIINLIRKRLTLLSSFSLMEIFSYISIIFLSILKPFKLKNEN